jgi:hypothetical protein
MVGVHRSQSSGYHRSRNSMVGLTFSAAEELKKAFVWHPFVQLHIQWSHTLCRLELPPLANSLGRDYFMDFTRVSQFE